MADFTWDPLYPTYYLENVTFTDTSTDSDGFIVNWTWDFDDGNTGTGMLVEHTFLEPGTYDVMLTVIDDDGNYRNVTKSIVVTANDAPYAPSISGKTRGKAGIEYEYTFTATDPDGDDVSFYVEWGDDTSSGWTEFVSSEAEVKLKHTWVEEDTYTIKAKAKDIFGAESGWSTLEVSMPNTKEDFSKSSKSTGSITTQT